MANNNKVSGDSSGAPIIGIRSDVYERRLELIWMSKDDIEHFESRLGDKTLFQNIALFLLSASLPLLVEKWLDYTGSGSPIDLAIVIVCAAAAVSGCIAQGVAISRKQQLETFRDRLFKREQKLDTTLQMFDSSSSTPEYGTKGAA